MATFVEQFARPGRRRLVVLAAHPDDETIGATMAFEGADPWVLFLTDGAPENEKLRGKNASVDRERYAKMRREEAVRALAQVGVAPHRIRSLGATDQDAALHLATLTRACADFLEQVGADVLLTQPYEGGHPDHDATAFVAQAACAMLEHRGSAAPLRIEMTSYHFGENGLVTGRFLPGSRDVFELPVEGDARSRKQAMFSAYASQREVLASFHLDVERFRVAPLYDFRAPPHAGATHYDRLGWPMNSQRFCDLAQEAAFALGSEEVRWA